MAAVSTYSTQEFISEDMIQEIASVDGIEGYDASFILMPFFYDETGKALPAKVYSFSPMALSIPEYSELFLSGN